MNTSGRSSASAASSGSAGSASSGSSFSNTGNTAAERSESFEAMRQHKAQFSNCVEQPSGSGNFILPLRKKLLYAMPGLGYYMIRYLRTTQMKKFYADWLGVPLWWIAFVVALAVSLDALTDPLIGYLSDSSRCTIRGKPMRRRPFIAVGSLLLCCLYLLLWSPCLFFGSECGVRTPHICDSAAPISGPAPHYFLVLYVLYFCSMGLTLIPYGALGAELTPGHRDRSNLMATYFAATVIGILLAIVAPMLVNKDSDTGLLVFASIACAIFGGGAWGVACTMEERAPEHGNPPPVPSMLNCLRNPVFRALLLNRLIESVGMETQFTVLPFVVSYVIDPEYERDGTPVVDGMDEDTVFTLLGGGLLLFQLLSIPLWLKLTHWKGKYMAYLVWNVVQVVSIALKIFVTHHSIVAGAIFAVLWGIGGGGSEFLIRTILADVYEHDQLITGERREGEFGVYIDFFGEKLPQIPGQVVPLMLMSSLGYVANQHPQPASVVWLLRLCFSIIPAATGLLAVPILLFLYPAAAKDDKKFLDEVQAGLARHRKGLAAVDPVTGKVLLPPAQLQAAVDPHAVLKGKSGSVGVGGGDGEQARMRGQRACEAFDHFALYELRAAINRGEKKVLVFITAVHTALTFLAICALVVWAAFDWKLNITGSMAAAPACSATSQPGVLDSGGCSAGFYGVACALACPGLELVGTEPSEYAGLPCSGFGSCDASGVAEAGLTAICECDEGYAGLDCSEPASPAEEPLAFLPIIVALLGFFTFLFFISVLRLREAVRIQSAGQFVVGGRDVTLETIAVRVSQLTDVSPIETNIRASTYEGEATRGSVRWI